MINNDMRLYDYFTFGANDDYGQPVLSDVAGTVKMAIYIYQQALEDTINYAECQYVGITLNKEITDKTVIQYGDKKLKVMYIVEAKRCRQVIMAEL